MRKVATLLSMLALTAACASIKDEPNAALFGPSPNPSAASQFQRIKSLVGDWQWAADLAPSLSGHVASYRLTADGTCVVETLFPGHRYEMITIYHLAGDQLLLTNYSNSGNQPTLRALPGGPEDAIHFEFHSAAGLLDESDSHMASMTILSATSELLITTWAIHEDGQLKGNKVFKLAPFFPVIERWAESPWDLNDPSDLDAIDWDQLDPQ